MESNESRTRKSNAGNSEIASQGTNDTHREADNTA